MPGPVSDSYDPDFGTGERAALFREQLQDLHTQVGRIIGAPPVDFRTLMDHDPGPMLEATLSERDWRFIRYALESAADGV